MQSTDRVETQMQTMLKLAAWLHCWLGLSRVTPSARASSSPSGICHYSALCIVQCAFCPVWLQFSDCFETKSKFVNIFSKTVHLGCSPGPPRPFHPLLTKAASSEWVAWLTSPNYPKINCKTQSPVQQSQAISWIMFSWSHSYLPYQSFSPQGTR